MKRCWRCRKEIETYCGPHHIDGNHSNDLLINQITLCQKCHDLVQGICDKCLNQKDCHIKRFQKCWHFEDALPPIYFKSITETAKEMKKEIRQYRKTLVISINGIDTPVKCMLCNADIKDNADPGKDIICPLCTQFLSQKPRMLGEDFEDWKNRIFKAMVTEEGETPSALGF